MIGAINIALLHIGFGYSYCKIGIAFSRGVQLFFCISAFLMMYTTVNRSSPIKLFFRRLIRLLPLYWMLTILSFVAAQFIGAFSQGEIGAVELIKSLFLIPYTRSALRSDEVVRPIVGLGWTMYYEVLFLICFCISMKINHKFRGTICMILIGVVHLIAQLIDTDTAFLVIIRSEYILYFIGGILAYEAVRLLWGKKYIKTQPTKITLCIVAVLCMLMLYRDNIGDTWVLLPLCICVVVATILAFRKTRVPKFIVFCGEISYSFYLLHYFVILFLEKVVRVFDFSVLTGKTFLGIVLVFGLSAVGAYFSSQLIEKRFSSWLIKQLKL